MGASKDNFDFDAIFANNIGAKQAISVEGASQVAASKRSNLVSPTSPTSLAAPPRSSTAPPLGSTPIQPMAARRTSLTVQEELKQERQQAQQDDAEFLAQARDAHRRKEGMCAQRPSTATAIAAAARRRGSEAPFAPAVLEGIFGVNQGARPSTVALGQLKPRTHTPQPPHELPGAFAAGRSPRRSLVTHDQSEQRRASSTKSASLSFAGRSHF